MTSTKNKLSDLNDHLFAQLDRLAKDDLTPEQLDKEVARGKAMAAVADQIVKNATLQVVVAKAVAEKGMIRPLLPEAAGLPEPARKQLVDGKRQ